MNILLVGNGGREHALAWALAKSPHCDTLYLCPGNPGTAELGENLPINADDYDGIVRAAKEHQVEMVVIGPEQPLADGLADKVRKEGILCFGPSAEGARLEADKAFAKELMRSAAIATAEARIFHSYQQARDYVLSRDKTVFFEPAVLMPTTTEANRRQLKVLSDFAMTDGGILTNIVQYPAGAPVETTLVIIKPDNFAKRSSRPGNIIDVFSRTGLYIVSAKLLRFSREQAEEFYGPLRSIFVRKLSGQAADRAAKALGQTFNFEITEEMKGKLADVLKEPNADFEFRKIVSYMTGQDESGATLPLQERGKCVAMLYQGENAIAKIRQRLGSTNPKEAEEGTIRSLYGYDLMKNGAHASDSAENAERERKIVGLWQEGASCESKDLIDKFLADEGKRS